MGLLGQNINTYQRVNPAEGLLRGLEVGGNFGLALRQQKMKEEELKLQNVYKKLTVLTETYKKIKNPSLRNALGNQIIPLMREAGVPIPEGVDYTDTPEGESLIKNISELMKGVNEGRITPAQARDFAMQDWERAVNEEETKMSAKDVSQHLDTQFKGMAAEKTAQLGELTRASEGAMPYLKTAPSAIEERERLNRDINLLGGAVTDFGDKLTDTQLYSVLVNSANPAERQKAAAMLEFRRAQAEEVTKTTGAKRKVEIKTAAELEKEKGRGEVEGKGIITPIKKKTDAQKRITGTLEELKGHYEKLDSIGAIVNIKKGVTRNVVARAAASEPGQAVGKAAGTEAQSLRNKINMMRPLIINYIRQASEMGVRGIDSERELQFYLQAATDPGLDIQTNLNAIRVLDNAYGITGQKNEDGKAEEPEMIRRKGSDGNWYVNDGTGWRPE